MVPDEEKKEIKPAEKVEPAPEIPTAPKPKRKDVSELSPLQANLTRNLNNRFEQLITEIHTSLPFGPLLRSAEYSLRAMQEDLIAEIHNT